MDTKNTPFSLTPAARTRIAYLLSDEPAGTAFHVAVQGGGCSGFQYNFDLSSKPLAADDHVLEEGGSRVVIDDVSLGILAGSTLDYEEDLMSAGFVIKNPNATARCGCGNSFSVAL